MANTREQNLQSSILFMQQEHANTLRGLHDEIHKLQNKCKDLTFQLAMETTSTSQEDYYKEKCETLEKDLITWQKKGKDLEDKANERETRISQLEKRLKRLEFKHMDELNAKSELIKKFQGQLLAKADEVANLQMTALSSRTKQVTPENETLRHSNEHRRLSSGSSPRTSIDRHRLSTDSPIPSSAERRRSSNSTPNSADRAKRRSSASSEASSLETSPHGDTIAPAPPSHSSTHQYSRRRGPLTNAKNRPASSRKIDVDVQESLTDPTEILEITRQQREELGLRVSTTTVLPPIPPTGPPRVLRPHNTNSAAFARRRPPVESRDQRPGQLEVETLAVDQVNGSRQVDLRRAHEFNSHDMQ